MALQDAIALKKEIPYPADSRQAAYDGSSEAASSIKVRRGLQKWIGEKKGRSPDVPSTPTSRASFESKSVFWPADLLGKEEDLKDARILTYGYDSHVSHFFDGPANQNSISAHGKTLLNRLAAKRRRDPKRPIVFIAHSLGGLVLKSSLISSKSAIEEHHDLRDIYDCTLGILFLGTPHRGGGSNYADWGLYVSNIARAVGFDTNNTILRSLRIDSEILEIQREDFSRMLLGKAFNIDTFKEEKGLKEFRGLTGKVVEDASSVLGDARERVHGISANHVDMCRFKGPDDPGYEDIRDVLLRHINALTQVQKAEYELCRNSLFVPEMDSRHSEIENRYNATLEWMYTEPAHKFVHWLQSGNGIYWIRGLPASGKSTAMKFVSNDPRTLKALRRTGLQWLVPRVFFYDRGTKSQKTLEGILSSVLFQIMTEVPALTKVISPCGSPSGYQRTSFELAKDQYETGSTVQIPFSWTTEKLQDALRAIVNQEAIHLNVCLFIDALDEHHGDHQQMMSFFKELVERKPLQYVFTKICVASRDENVFRDPLSGSTVLDIHNWTHDDITQVVFGRMKQHPQMQKYLATGTYRATAMELMERIVDRARGVFLWVQLVVDDLLEGLTDRHPLRDLGRRLDDLPDTLDEFYQRILEKVAEKNVFQCYAMLEAVLCARNPLTLSELAVIVELAVDKISNHADVDAPCLGPRLDKTKIDEIQSEATFMEFRIKSCCKGLLQVHYPSDEPLPAMVGTLMQDPESHREAETSSNSSAGPYIGLFSTDTNPLADMAESAQPSQYHVERHEATIESTASHSDEATVQLLHQTVKEFLRRPGILDMLFTRKGGSQLGKSPKDNGHVYILDFCLQWLLSGQWSSKAFSKYKNTSFEVAYQGPLAEATMRKPLTGLFDAIDYALRARPCGRSAWPNPSGGPFGDKFLAFASRENMQLYVNDKLSSDPSLLCTGTPLLYFALAGSGAHDIPHPGMVRIILRHYSELRRRSRGYSVHSILDHAFSELRRQSLIYDSQGQPHREIMELLLDAGASPNSRLKTPIIMPVVHDVMVMNMDPQPKLDLLKTFHEYGASFKLLDQHKRGILDNFFFHEAIRHSSMQVPCSTDIIRWLFQQGAVISLETASHDEFRTSGNILYYNEFRKPEHYSIPAFWAMKKYHPDWPISPSHYLWRLRTEHVLW